MSLRRSSRGKSLGEQNGEQQSALPTPNDAPTKKRGRQSKGAEAVVSSTNGTADEAKSAMPPPPSTPNKRRKVVKTEQPPPFTPTPSAVGLIGAPGGNYSTGDIDDVSPPPPTRRVEPRHTNAPLLTPRGTQVEPTYSNFEESPSKAGSKSLTTNKSLLEDACAHLISTDAKLAPVVNAHHCRVFSPEGLAETIDPFRSLASGIMAQQVSGAAARSIKNKFIGLFPPESCPNGFPTVAVVSRTSLPRLREAGLSQRKAEYIQGLAQKFHDRELTVDMLMNGTDEEVMEKLVAVRGLGRWSVEMFMCFGLKRMDVFSTGDLGVQRGMAAYMGRDVAKLKAKGGGKWKYMSEKDMLDISEKFRPYRSLFMWVSGVRCPPIIFEVDANMLNSTCGGSRMWMLLRWKITRIELEMYVRFHIWLRPYQYISSARTTLFSPQISNFSSHA